MATDTHPQSNSMDEAAMHPPADAKKDSGKPCDPVSPKSVAAATSGDTSKDTVREPSEEATPKISESLENQLKELQTKLDATHTRYLQALADLDNLRKRFAKERQTLIQQAAATLIEALLPILDHFQKGLEAAEQKDELQTLYKGFNMIFEQLYRTLCENGLQPINPAGATFDPNLHECVAHQPSDTVDDGNVIAVIRIGYRLYGHLLRPATVVVSSGIKKAEAARS